MRASSRKEAKEQGLTRYFTGKPCKHGHVAERSVVNAECMECSRIRGREKHKKHREKNNARKKRHYQENREEILARQKEYRENNKEKIKAKDKKYYEENREHVLETQREYKENNPEKVKETSKKSSEKNKKRIKEYARQYCIDNKEKRSEYNRQFYQENKDYYVAKDAERRARKIQATPAWADMEKVYFFYECCPDGCHVDHIIPLNHPLVCGLHNEFNLQWLPAEENLSKGNKFEIEQ